MKREEILHLANLSKLEFSEQELLQFCKEFDSILQFVSQVEKAKIDCEMVLPTVACSDLREDVVRASLGRDELVANAPESSDGYFVVPQVVE